MRGDPGRRRHRHRGLGLVDGLAAPSDPLRLPDVAPPTGHGLAEEPVSVLLPAGHPLAARTGLCLDDLAVARRLDAPDAALPLDQLRAATGAGAFRPALRYEGTDLRILTALAAAGVASPCCPARPPPPYPARSPSRSPRPGSSPHGTPPRLLHGGTPGGAEREVVRRLVGTV
ncbi:hypothetical protein [Streptomyces barringtoniae]|uniref:hypothetical protein n=1 Tax=Streptomyces barringtoniae TaxID=2892029 RepID=UPI003557D444